MKNSFCIEEYNKMRRFLLKLEGALLQLKYFYEAMKKFKAITSQRK